MSILGDAVQTINEDVEVAAFLPGANFVFLHISSKTGTDWLFAFTFASAVVGATLFNHLRALDAEDGYETGIDSGRSEEDGSEEWSDPREADYEGLQEKLQRSQRSVSAVLFVSWGGLLIWSMYLLSKDFAESWILPEVLFFVSLAFLALYATRYVLEFFVEKDEE